MTPNELQQTIQTAYHTKLPLFIWGSPGIGKSDIVRQAARSLDIKLIDLRAALLDPIDLRGFPQITGNTTAWIPPCFLPTEGRGILFLDELNSAPPTVQAACYQLVLDRAIGEYHLPEEWHVIAAGNLESDRSVTHRMPTALANRFLHATLQPTVNDFCQWAQNTQAPAEIITLPTIDSKIITPEIQAFLKFRPSLLHKMPDSKSQEKAFPTPRSWSMISRIQQCNLPTTLAYSLYSGLIGEGAAAEFSGFIKICQSLPDIQDIISRPATASLPQEPAALYAIIGALARISNTNNISPIMAYAYRMANEWQSMLISDIKQKWPAFTETRTYIDWITARQNILL